MNKLDKIAAQIVAAAEAGNANKVANLLDRFTLMARQDGADSLLIDLWGANEISHEGVEFAVENNGCADPR